MKSALDQAHTHEQGRRKRLENAYQRRFVRNIELGSLLETFLVSAIAAVLLIRFYLALTNYPQIGSGIFHIAHLLWGGMLMLLAIVLLLSYKGQRIQFMAAFIGGAGFGTFIDELGKFITRDNDYFFRPTIALIYVIFVLLLMAFRTLEQIKFTEREKVAAALDLMQQAMISGWTTEDKNEAFQLLQASNRRDNLAIVQLQQAINLLPTRPPSGDSWIEWFGEAIRNGAQRVLESRFLTILILAILIAGALLSTLFSSFFIVFSNPQILFQLTSRHWTAYFDESCLIVTSLIANLFLLIGAVYLLRGKSLQGYRWFKRALLVSIFLTQVFLFYIQQLSALGGLVFNLVALVVIEFLLHNETKHSLVSGERV